MMRAACAAALLWGLAVAEPLERSLMGKKSGGSGSAGTIAASAAEDVAKAMSCSAMPSCEACLAEDSGCYGWLGDKCCSEQACKMAMAGDRMFYRSCAAWDKKHRLASVCSSVPQNDACACLKAGCVAQKTGDVVSCFAEFQGAAGPAATCKEKGFTEKSSSSTVVQDGEFCEGSPQQLCRMMCQPMRCAPDYCLMRTGPCCDLTCMARP